MRQVHSVVRHAIRFFDITSYGDLLEKSVARQTREAPLCVSLKRILFVVVMNHVDLAIWRLSMATVRLGSDRPSP